MMLSPLVFWVDCPHDLGPCTIWWPLPPIGISRKTVKVAASTTQIFDSLALDT
jgi:hypothetical protein